MLMDQEDNRAPPGFAVVVHHTPHQLLARLVCRSDSRALQASTSCPCLSAAGSTVSNKHAQSTKPAQPNVAHMLAVTVKSYSNRKEKKDAHTQQQMHHSYLASA